MVYTNTPIIGLIFRESQCFLVSKPPKITNQFSQNSSLIENLSGYARY